MNLDFWLRKSGHSSKCITLGSLQQAYGQWNQQLNIVYNRDRSGGKQEHVRPDPLRRLLRGMGPMCTTPLTTFSHTEIIYSTRATCDGAENRQHRSYVWFILCWVKVWGALIIHLLYLNQNSVFSCPLKSTYISLFNLNCVWWNSVSLILNKSLTEYLLYPWKWHVTGKTSYLSIF